MHIISRKPLDEFSARHPETEGALLRWYDLMKSKQYNSFAELRADFPSADQVDRLTVFNIGGNKVRLIAGVRYAREKKSGTVYVRAILTHSEYDEGKWKE
jgi:mRNA interferase HigB